MKATADLLKISFMVTRKEIQDLSQQDLADLIEIKAKRAANELWEKAGGDAKHAPFFGGPRDAA